MKNIFLEIATLSTPRGRVIFVVTASLLVFIVPFQWLNDLSLWKRLGLDWAPSIGLTRAYWLMLHSNFRAAVAFNPLILPVMAIAATLMVVDISKIFGYTEVKSPNKGEPHG